MSGRTINPFRSALGEVVKRLAWDARPESWRSRRLLRGWRDRHRGESAVILCNGPSLAKVDLSQLANVFTFGLNKIDLLFERSAFRPSCIVAVNKLVLEQNASFFSSTNIPLFLDHEGLAFVQPRSNVAFLHSTAVRGRAFAEDCSISVPQGGTVTFVALQLAFHMGFTRVAIVGCDHSYAQTGKPNAVVTSGETDPSHFDPRYFAGGQKWQLPDLLQSELSYRTSLDAYEAAGRMLVNATAGGKLELLPRMPLADFLAGVRR
ncbi:MAG: 6-hydroxymethylpterin diphosphokinase MptE-like protein [Kofleriaceae bacterium]